MLRVDFHVHSIASVHALNSIDELLQIAETIGMEGLAVTDHSPGTDNTIWLARNRSNSDCWNEQIRAPDMPYFMNFLSRYHQPRERKVKLFKGIECNILSDGKHPTDIPRFVASQFDLVIASVHPIPSIFEIENREQITERMILAMNDPIDIIGHPTHKNHCPFVEPLVKAASEKDIVLEINNASLELGKADMGETLKMLKLAKKMECGISISSDAHVSSELGNDATAAKIIVEARFPKELVVNQSLQTAIDFTAKRREVRKKFKT